MSRTGQVESAESVVIRPSRIGMGLFAARDFLPLETIIKIAGRIVDWRVLRERGGTFADNCLRFGPETYLDPGDLHGRFLNHSCEPNAGVRKAKSQLFLFAVAAIRDGDEIVVDYSTTIGDDDIWTMRCRCGRPTCRSRIRRFGTLPRALKDRYLRDGLVPGYIIDTLSERPNRIELAGRATYRRAPRGTPRSPVVRRK
jgi:hypothetical protein